MQASRLSSRAQRRNPEMPHDKAACFRLPKKGLRQTGRRVIARNVEISGRRSRLHPPQQGGHDEAVKRQDDRQIDAAEPVMRLDQRGRGACRPVPDAATSTTRRKSRWASLNPVTRRSGCSLRTGNIPIVARETVALRRGVFRPKGATRKFRNPIKASIHRGECPVIAWAAPRASSAPFATSIAKASTKSAPASSAAMSVAGTTSRTFIAVAACAPAA